MPKWVRGESGLEASRPVSQSCILSSNRPYNVSPSLSDFTWYDNLYVPPWCSKWYYFILFNDWVIFHCIYVSHCLYPFLCREKFRLLPCHGYCKQCCSKHWGPCILSNHFFLQIYAQEHCISCNLTNTFPEILSPKSNLAMHQKNNYLNPFCFVTAKNRKETSHNRSTVK